MPRAGDNLFSLCFDAGRGVAGLCSSTALLSLVVRPCSLLVVSHRGPHVSVPSPFDLLGRFAPLSQGLLTRLAQMIQSRGSRTSKRTRSYVVSRKTHRETHAHTHDHTCIAARVPRPLPSIAARLLRGASSACRVASPRPPAHTRVASTMAAPPCTRRRLLSALPGPRGSAGWPGTRIDLRGRAGALSALPRRARARAKSQSWQASARRRLG